MNAVWQHREPLLKFINGDLLMKFFMLVPRLLQELCSCMIQRRVQWRAEGNWFVTDRIVLEQSLYDILGCVVVSEISVPSSSKEKLESPFFL